MKYKTTKVGIVNFLLICLLFGMTAKLGLANNPIISNQGVCDPHIRIINGKAYLFATHDYSRGNSSYRMDDWWIWSSPDLVNWTKEFTLLPENMWTGYTKNCWATDGAERNGKYYFYVSANWKTGVAVSTTGPEGPYTDALGKALYSNYDPTVFIDDDENKTPYLVTGGFPYKIGKLNEDMISLAETPKEITHTSTPWNGDGGFLHKHNGIYYLNGHGAKYSTSTDIYGPYNYRGVFLEPWTDHTTVFEWNNQSYVAFGWGDDDQFFRKTHLTYLHYKTNGDMVADQFVSTSSFGVGQYDATKTIQAEWYFAASDSVKKNEVKGGFEMRNLGNNEYLYYQNVWNVSENASISFKVSSATGGIIEVREDSTSGSLLGSCQIPNTGGLTIYQTHTYALINSAGHKNLYFVFKGSGTELMRLDNFKIQGFATTHTLQTSATNGSVAPVSGTYNWGTLINLIATPGKGYQFSSWSGDIAGTKSPITLFMDANKSITANFMLSDTISAFSTIEAESYTSMVGIQTESCNEGGNQIGYIETGDYIVFNNVNFGDGAASFDARYTSGTAGGSIEVRLDGLKGTLIGVCKAAGTGGWDKYATSSCLIGGATGTHDVYIKFKGSGGYLFNLNWLKFTAGASTPLVIPITGWVSGTSNNKVSGSNRLMTVMVMGASTAEFSALGVTYGDQQMTKQTEKIFTNGFSTYAAIFTLNEKAVNAATSGIIAVNWSTTPEIGKSVYSVLLSNVDQTAPVSATANHGLESATIATNMLMAAERDMVVMCGATGSNNTITFENSFTKQFETNSSWGDGTGGYKTGTGVNETPSFTQSTNGNMVLCAIVVSKSTKEEIPNSVLNNEVIAGISIFPNPVTKTLYLNFSESNAQREIRLFNSDGRCLYSKNATELVTEIDVEALATKGLVFVQVITGQDVSIFKVIVK